MAFNTSAWGNDGNTYGERSMRELVAALTGGQTGVVGESTALKVTQQAAPANTVKAAAGGIVIPATAAGSSGSYADWNDADLTSPAFTPTGADPRKDRVIARVTAGVTALEIIEGTPGAVPAEPAITGDDYLELAMVTLPAVTTNITDAMITDRRVRLAAGTPVVCTSTTRPASPYEGMQIFETDTDKEYIYSGSAWVEVGRLGAWTAYTPTWTATGTPPTLGNGTISGRYRRSGRLIVFEAELVIGSTSSGGTGSYTLVAPVAAAAGIGVPIPVHIDAVAISPAMGRLQPGTTSIFPIGYGNSLTFGNAAPALTTGDTICWGGTYEAAS